MDDPVFEVQINLRSLKHVADILKRSNIFFANLSMSDAYITLSANKADVNLEFKIFILEFSSDPPEVKRTIYAPKLIELVGLIPDDLDTIWLALNNDNSVNITYCPFCDMSPEREHGECDYLTITKCGIISSATPTQ